jgi:hypothetical protein
MNDEHWILDKSPSDTVNEALLVRIVVRGYINTLCFGVSCAFHHSQQAVQEHTTAWLSDNLVQLHLVDLNVCIALTPTASQGSLTPKAFDVQLLPLSPTAKYHRRTLARSRRLLPRSAPPAAAAASFSAHRGLCDAPPRPNCHLPPPASFAGPASRGRPSLHGRR